MIGLVGGTFDPVHYGHLIPVERLATELNLPEVRYVLSARPPHRAEPLAGIDDRYRMLQLALEEYPGFEPDDQEIRRRGPSYTLWTVRKLRQRYAHDSLCLILGMDAYLGLHDWHRWQEIMALVNIVVLSRPGWERDYTADDGDRRSLLCRRSGVVVFAESPEMPLAATDLRRRLQRGDDVSDAIPAVVLEYIKHKQLYGVDPQAACGAMVE